jgi:DNA-binding beta-propeller fold protein YncE
MRSFKQLWGLAGVAACLQLAACTGGSGSSGSPSPSPSPSPPPSSSPPTSPSFTISQYPAPKALDGQVIDLLLPHNALVYDGGRNVYYATVPASVSGVGNSIAIINPTTETIRFSAAIGSEPGELALSADGSVLYVGLNGSGEVVRLALPAMTEQGRVRLLSNSLLGQSTAENIAVSPTDPTVAAVAMVWPGGRPNNAGVALLRDMVMQPRGTALFAGSDLVTFDPTGTTLYGWNLDTDGAIRRMEVLADGVAEQAILPYAGSGAPTFSFANGRLIAGRALYNAPELTAAGLISAAAHCWPRRSGTQLLCPAVPDFTTGQARLVLADAETFVFQDSLLIAVREGAPFQLVEGPTGQVALRYGNGVRFFSSERLNSPPPVPSVSWPVVSSSSSTWRILDVGILHNALTYDSVHKKYYASVPGFMMGVGNSIAVIDPATGQVTHSAPVGSEPNALAISPDGSALYVGLNGSGEIVRLALPSMTEQGRTRLPLDFIGNQLTARSIAVSPADPTVAAVSMARWDPFATSAAVALVRDMVMQPNRTQGRSDLLAFDSSGTTLYGLNTIDSEFGLRRIQVLADGLAEQRGGLRDAISRVHE